MQTKKNTTHTPGPWHINQVRNHPFVSSVNGERIADCGPDDDNWLGWESEEQAPANARLIAAAPCLLAACLLALEKLETTGEYPGIAKELADAITKAEN